MKENTRLQHHSEFCTGEAMKSYSIHDNKKHVSIATHMLCTVLLTLEKHSFALHGSYLIFLYLYFLLECCVHIFSYDFNTSFL